MNKITFSFPLACLLLFNGCATNNAFMDNIGKIGGTTVGAGAGAVVRVAPQRGATPGRHPDRGSGAKPADPGADRRVP